MKKWQLLIVGLFFLGPGLSAQSFDQAWETERLLKTPESVLYDAGRNQIYVSNINGKPKDKDTNGFISVLDTSGKISKLKWLTGLHAPKGMAQNDSLLFVTDIDRIVVVDINQAKIVKMVDVPGAGFLNDLVMLPAGDVIVSDMEKNQF